MRSDLLARSGRLGLLVLAGVLVGCGEPPAAPRSEVPRRIIAVAPGVTEMLFELGLGERVVGVGDYARWPPEVARKPRLGGLFDARLEAIAALDPDLAVLLPSEERLKANLERMGVEVLTVRSETIDDVAAMALRIAERCHVAEQAAEFRERWQRELTPRPLERPLSVLFSVTREPGRMADILVAGPGTFLDELLERLGAVNSMADAALEYPQVGLEEIVLRDPDVIIELQASPGVYKQLHEDWQRLGEDVSLADACVQVLAGDHVLIPGPRLPRLYRELWDALSACANARSPHRTSTAPPETPESAALPSRSSRSAP